MKTIKAISLIPFFILIILLDTINVFGQNEMDSKWDLAYWNIGAELGGLTERNQDLTRPIFGGINGSLYFSNHLILSASFKYSDNVKAKNDIPSDYYPGFILFGNRTLPEDILNNLTLSAGRYFVLQDPFLNLSLKAGVSYIEYVKVEYRPVEDRTFLGRSHTTHYPIKDRAIGLNLKAKLEFNGTTFMGSGIFVEGNINKQYSYLSLGFFRHFGKVRDRF